MSTECSHTHDTASSAMTKPKSIYGFSPESLPLPRDEILHHLRGLQEGMHRERLWQQEGRSKAWTQQFNAVDLDTLPEMNLTDANYCCNRTAPFYIMRDGCIPETSGPHAQIDMVGCVLELFLITLQNYLYKKWFRPYRSDIEYGQFLGRIIVTKPAPPPTSSVPNQWSI